MFEFLLFNQGIADQVPRESEDRRHWLRDWYVQIIRPRANRFRRDLIRQYGLPRGEEIECMEAFEISEYAAPLDRRDRERLFWFLPR